ncbi:MAG TPA: hypothetical protein VLV76_17550 [Candidatus Acidoferrum sp.]|nr:hypothetical protein [Candidatus Acidoferrum sp.]
MPGQISITFRNFWGLDPARFQRTQSPGRSGGSFQDSVLRGAIGALAGTAKRGPLLRSALGMITPPFGSISLSGMIPGVTIRSPRPDFTLTAGITAAGGAGVNFGGGAGMYFWNKSPSGEVGLYGGLSVGMITNIGASIGDQLCFLFGPAGTVLAGDSITVAVDVDIVMASVSGMLILSAPPVSLGWPPTLTGPWRPEVIGIGIALSVGISVLPVDISVMPGRTWIKPITP